MFVFDIFLNNFIYFFLDLDIFKKQNKTKNLLCRIFFPLWSSRYFADGSFLCHLVESVNHQDEQSWHASQGSLYRYSIPRNWFIAIINKWDFRRKSRKTNHPKKHLQLTTFSLWDSTHSVFLFWHFTAPTRPLGPLKQTCLSLLASEPFNQYCLSFLCPLKKKTSTQSVAQRNAQQAFLDAP